MPDDSIARRIVQTSLRIHEDDMVLIETWQHTIDLASDIALECLRTGAKPLVTLMTDRLWWKALEEIPEQYMRKTPRHMLNAIESTTVWIDVTPQRARAYGFDYNRWLKSTEDAIRVDYPKITELGKRIASRLERGSRVHVTSKLGTDIRFDVSKRPAHVQDGIVDEEDMARGLVSTQLPSGKVEVAPIETSGRGNVVFDTPRALKGRLITDLQLVFEKGRVREFHAKKYEDVFREVFEATQGDKDSIGHFAIGLNPKIELIGYPSDELALGTATIGIGANKGNGGLNDSSFEFSGTLTKPTIDIDGTALMVDGRLVL